MAVTRKFIDKKLLHNVIRNADAHNKIEEEKIMWRLHRVQNNHSNSKSSSYSKHRNKCRKISPTNDEYLESTSDKHWMKELMNYENSLSERWGHNGYRELYPEEFEEKTCNSGREKDDSNTNKLKRKKEKRYRKSRDKEGKRKRDKNKKSSSTVEVYIKRKSEKNRKKLEGRKERDSKSSDYNLKASKKTKKFKKAKYSS